MTRVRRVIVASVVGAVAILSSIRISMSSPHSTSTTSSSMTSSRFQPTKDRAIEYVLRWEWDDAVNHSFTTDLGYEVTLDEGYVGAMSFELAPCDGRAATRDRPIFTVDFATAEANHGRMHDTSLSEGAIASSIFEDAFEVGQSRASGASYCTAHVLAAPIDEVARDGFHLAHASVYLRGSYRSEDERVTHPFVASTTIADGAIVKLSFSDDALTNDARVEITRHPKRAFDGVRFEDRSGAAIAYAFLRRLDATTSVVVTRRF